MVVEVDVMSLRPVSKPGILAVVLLSLPVACGGESPPDDSDPPDDTIDTAPEDTAPEQVVPTIESCTWQCSEGSSSPDSLLVQLEADDPQGADTIDSMAGELTVSTAEGAELLLLSLVCDDEGDCFTSFNADDYTGVDCAAAPGLVAEVVVVDQDANRSEACVLSWLGYG